MLLGARQFFERRGAPVPPLPYDADVEYLESTGTQWIDTGVRSLSINGVFSFNIKSRFMTIINGYTGSGYSPSGSNQFFYALNSSNNTGLYICFNGRVNLASNLSNDKLAWHEVGAVSDGQKVTYSFDGNNVGVFDFYPISIYGLFMFAINNGSSRPNGTQCYAQISSASLSVAGDGVFDFIPVRFTNEQNQSEGAMYDRVSGALFRNAGTGAFTIGPDK